MADPVGSLHFHIQACAEMRQWPGAAGASLVNILYRCAFPLPLAALSGFAVRPCSAVLDNAVIHRSRPAWETQLDLAARDILRYLPVYNPELNASERTCRMFRHEAMPRP